MKLKAFCSGDSSLSITKTPEYQLGQLEGRIREDYLVSYDWRIGGGEDRFIAQGFWTLHKQVDYTYMNAQTMQP